MAMRLLAGLVRCRRCGRKLTVRYSGAKHNIPRYACHRGLLDHGEPRCIAFGGLRVDDAIEAALLDVVEPGAIAAAAEAEAEAASRRDQVREALARDLEAARYAADRAFRQYDAADPANRLVAAELEARWNRALARVGEVESKIAAHDAATPAPSRRSRRRSPRWPRSESRLVGADDRRPAQEAHRPHRDPRGDRRYRRRGRRDRAPDPLDGRRPHRAAPAQRRRGQRNSTSPDIVAAVRQLVLIANDDLIAGMLNRNKLTTGNGNRWTRERVTSLRSHHKIPCSAPRPMASSPGST